MRRLAGITITTFVAVAVAGSLGASPLDVGGGSDGDAEVRIEKVIPIVDDGDLPPSPWQFDVVSDNCGEAITPPSGGEPVSSLLVEIDAGGGTSEAFDLRVFSFYGGGGECEYTITERPQVGWVTSDPASGRVSIVPESAENLTVTFVNEPAPTTTTTTAVTTTTTTPGETTTTVADTTTTSVDTTIADTTTTVAPTTAPPTTAGTVAPELPATGTSNSLTALLAGLLVLGGVGAIIASRRTL